MAQLVPVDTFDLIIFGGTGDLAMRKLLPALYHRDCDGQITADSRIIAASRGELSREDYLGTVESSLRDSLADGDFDDANWQTFSQRIHYVHADAFEHGNWNALVDILQGHDDRVRVAYLATAPSLFGPISKGLKSNGLITDSSRIVLEKPLGRDVESAREINNAVGEFASIIILARRPSKTCWRCDSLIPCLSRYGDVAQSIMCNSPSLKTLALVGELSFTMVSAHCETWCRTTYCNWSVYSRWSRRRVLIKTLCAMRRSKSCARLSPYRRMMPMPIRFAVSMVRAR
jgi:hypothetical protein